MKAAAKTTLAIAADPKRLGARIGITAVDRRGRFARRQVIWIPSIYVCRQAQRRRVR
jgi:hypothetical protein